MTASTPVWVVAEWRVRGSIDEVLDLVERLRTASLAEPGCLGYEAYCAVGGAATVLLLEHYRDHQALDAHRASAHYRSLVIEGALPLLSSRQVQILRPHDPIAATDPHVAHNTDH